MTGDEPNDLTRALAGFGNPVIRYQQLRGIDFRRSACFRHPSTHFRSCTADGPARAWSIQPQPAFPATRAHFLGTIADVALTCRSCRTAARCTRSRACGAGCAGTTSRRPASRRCGAASGFGSTYECPAISPAHANAGIRPAHAASTQAAGVDSRSPPSCARGRATF